MAVSQHTNEAIPWQHCSAHDLNPSAPLHWYGMQDELAKNSLKDHKPIFQITLSAAPACQACSLLSLSHIRTVHARLESLSSQNALEFLPPALASHTGQH